MTRAPGCATWEKRGHRAFRLPRGGGRLAPGSGPGGTRYPCPYPGTESGRLRHPAKLPKNSTAKASPPGAVPRGVFSTWPKPSGRLRLLSVLMVRYGGQLARWARWERYGEATGRREKGPGMVRAESCRTQGRTRKTAGGPAGTSGPRTRRTKGRRKHGSIQAGRSLVVRIYLRGPAYPGIGEDQPENDSDSGRTRAAAGTRKDPGRLTCGKAGEPHQFRNGRRAEVSRPLRNQPPGEVGAFAIGRLAHVAPGPHRRRGTGLPSRPGWRRRHRAVRSTWKWAS